METATATVTPMCLCDNAASLEAMCRMTMTAMIRPVLLNQAPQRPVMGLTTTATTALTKPTPVDAQLITMMGMVTATEVHPIHSACAPLLAATMSPTAAIAMIPTEMPVPVRVLGLAVIVETATLTITATILKASAIMAAVAVVAGRAAPQTTAGTAETHPAETMVHGSLAAPPTGSAAIKVPKPAHKSVDRDVPFTISFY